MFLIPPALTIVLCTFSVVRRPSAYPVPHTPTYRRVRSTATLGRQRIGARLELWTGFDLPPLPVRAEAGGACVMVARSRTETISLGTIYCGAHEG